MSDPKMVLGSQNQNSMSGSGSEPSSSSSDEPMVVNERFSRVQKVGEGSFGVVLFKARDTESEGHMVSIKTMPVNTDTDYGGGIPGSAMREISLLKGLIGNPNIINLLDVILDTTKLYIVFEYLDMDLRKLMDMHQLETNPMPFDQIKSYAWQIFKALRHCHTNRVIHFGLKPQNLLIDSKGCLKLADFGLARIFNFPPRQYTSEINYVQMVTLWYRCPEILLESQEYITTLDIWSAGCIFAEMFSLKPLFPGDSKIDQVSRIFQALGTPSKDIWPKIDKMPKYKDLKGEPLEALVPSMAPYPRAIDLLKNMFIYDPFERFTAQQCMEHLFFP